VSTSRRTLIRTLGLAPLCSPGVSAWAAAASAATQPRLLVVFLRGAYDATNVVVPHASSFYYESRPNIALARPGSGEQAALELNADWALHPALRESLWPLWQARSLAFVPFSGLDDPSRSHFEMQDKIEFGRGTVSRDYSAGFLNRLAQELPQSTPVAFTDTLPIVLRGGRRVPNIGLQGRVPVGMDERRVQQIQQMYEGTALAPQVRDGFNTREQVSRELAGEMEAAGRGAVSPRNFSAVAPRVARLLRESYSLAFVDIGRWDTHVGQGAASGILADRLQDLGAGLAQIAQGLGEVWSRTTVVVLSEFGRTFRENGNKGTDHGHGSAMWVLGGGVRGGRVLGEQVASDARNLHEGRDWPVLNDYRAVLAGLFARQYGLGPAALAKVFPEVKPLELGLL